MSQFVEINWALRIHQAERLKKGDVAHEIKKGYRFFPISTTIDLLNKKKEAIGKAQIIKIEVKLQKNLTTHDFLKCGFNDLSEMLRYLDEEYPEESEVVSIIKYKVL